MDYFSGNAAVIYPLGSAHKKVREVVLACRIVKLLYLFFGVAAHRRFESEDMDMTEKEFEKLCNELMLQASDNGHKVPILAITIDLEKYNKEKNGSCDFCVIPDLQNDKHLRDTLFELVDYIRENYDCNEFVRI